MTLQRAALFAAITAVLQLIIYLVYTFAPYINVFLQYGAPNVPNQFLFGSSVVLAVVWAAFLFTIYRECSGLAMRLPSQKIAFILVLLRAGTFLGIDVASMFLAGDWRPDARAVLGMATSAGWLAFLIAYAINPDASRARTTSLCLAALVAVSGVYSSRGPVEYWLSHPAASWTSFARLAVPILDWIADALFLWQFWRTRPVALQEAS